MCYVAMICDISYESFGGRRQDLLAQEVQPMETLLVLVLVVVAAAVIGTSRSDIQLPPQVIYVQPEPQAGLGCLPLLVLAVLVVGLIGTISF
jgi:hypothetical protein